MDEQITEPLDRSGRIYQQLVNICHETDNTEAILKRLEQEKQTLAWQCSKRQNLDVRQNNFRSNSTQLTITQAKEYEQLLFAEKERLEYQLKENVRGLIESTNKLEENIELTIHNLSLVQSTVLDEELARWKNSQWQLNLEFGDQILDSPSLETIQLWCERLAIVIWENRQQLKAIQRLKQNIPPLAHSGANSRLQALQEKVKILLSTLVTTAFVVEVQPPPVVKTHSRFPSDPIVRLLIGSQLNIHMSRPKVTANIISEAEARALLERSSDSRLATSGKILNNTKFMEYNENTRRFACTFRNMKLTSIDRPERHNVTDEKFCLHFKCQFTIGEAELNFKIWTLSAPIVVIVNISQEAKAWATITWDNAFFESRRLPFQVPDQVPWYRVAQALSAKFKSMTGRGLTQQNLQFLGEKIFSNSNFQSNELVTWSRFSKELLPDREFTFWEWFFAILKLTKDYLRESWMDGHVIGFVGRQETENMLSTSLGGTFIIRFSDSKLGAVTVAWVQSFIQQQILSVDPFNSKDLATRSLTNRIFDLFQLIYLYPNIPKDLAFGEYCTIRQDVLPPTTMTIAPYLPRDTITTIPGLVSAAIFGINGPN